jgi:glycosyltransferase involved in cell wall biosynthesis
MFDVGSISEARSLFQCYWRRAAVGLRTARALGFVGYRRRKHDSESALVGEQMRANNLAFTGRKRSCVIIVENLSVPFDRRVWQEAQSLNKAGWQVAVICPSSARHPEKFEEIDGIAIYRHKLPLEAKGRFAFLLEYTCALFHELRLLIKVYLDRGFNIIQACNPPDLIFLVALPFKLFGKRFIFDHHDVVPELFYIKFKQTGIFHHLLLWCEWLTFKSADLVISSNETLREIAVNRGGKRPEKVIAIYGVPDRKSFYRTAPDDGIRNGRKFALGYIGIIGDQDGLDHVIHAVHHLLRDQGYEDFQAIIVGDGPALPAVRALCRALAVEEHVTFTGYLTGDRLRQHISTFDIGLIPDPVNEFNDKISMNKVFEYSTLGIPIVAYPLTETQRLLGDAAVYAKSADPSGLAAACLELMSDNALRASCATKARQRASESFSWEREAGKYVRAFERVLNQ